MFALTTMAVALFGTGFAVGRISSSEVPTEVNTFNRLELRDGGMICISHNGEEVANVWIDHRDRIEVEFPQSNLEVHEAFGITHRPDERVTVSTLTIRNEYWERSLLDDEFVPLDGFRDDPLYDEEWSEEEVADLMELINGDPV